MLQVDMRICYKQAYKTAGFKTNRVGQGVSSVEHLLQAGIQDCRLQNHQSWAGNVLTDE